MLREGEYFLIYSMLVQVNRDGIIYSLREFEASLVEQHEGMPSLKELALIRNQFRH